MAVLADGTFEIRGHVAYVRHGYQAAAVFGPWLLVPAGPSKWTVTGKSEWVHGHWFMQNPLTLMLDVGEDRWQWDGIKPHVVSGDITVVLTGRPRIECGAAGQG